MARPKLAINRDTRSELIQVAQDMIQTKGFYAFTFQELSDRLKIRKASIHYYFPSKADLGIEIVELRIKWFKSWFQGLEDRKLTPLEKIEAYINVFHSVSVAGKRVCTCGAFTIVWPVLPGKLQNAVKNLTNLQINWLTETLGQGRKNGEMGKSGTAQEQAQVILASLLGGLQTSRALRNYNHFREITRHWMNSLRNQKPGKK